MVPMSMRRVGTALHVAAWNDSHESIRVLLSHGADVNAKSEDGRTALQGCA